MQKHTALTARADDEHVFAAELYSVAEVVRVHDTTLKFLKSLCIVLC